MIHRRPDVIAVLALVALPFLVFAPTIVTGRVLSAADNLLEQFPWRALAPAHVAHDPTMTDITMVVHPSVLHAAREIGAGRFPLWNPDAYAGVPFFANPHTAVLFPLTALAYVLPVPIAVTLGAVVKLAAAGAGMYWFLRVLNVVPLAAVTGALAFMLNGALIGWLQWTFASSMIFLPLIFGLVERLRQSPRPRLVAGLALVIALDLLAGYPQGVFHALLAGTGWALVRAGSGGGRLAFLGRYATGVVLGALLAAVQIVPFLEYMLESSVFAYRSQWTATASVPLRAAITALTPQAFGSGRQYTGDWHFNIVTVYVGLVPLAALPVSLLAAWRTVPARFFAALAALVAAVYYGAPGFLALAELPGMSLITNLRLNALLAFALSALGALGLDAVARGAATPARALVAATRGWCLLVVWASLGWLLWRHTFPAGESIAAHYLPAVGLLAAAGVLIVLGVNDPHRTLRWDAWLVGIQLASLLPLAATYNPSIERQHFYPTPPVLARLRAATADHSRILMHGTVGHVYGLAEAHGFDGMTPRRIEDVVGRIGSGQPLGDGFLENTLAIHGAEALSPVKVLLSPAFDLLGVRYVVLGPDDPSPRPGLTLAYAGTDARVYRNEQALPRAFLVPRARCADDASALREMRGGQLRYRDEVLLAGCAVPPGSAAAPEAGTAVIEAHDPGEVRLTAHTPGGAYLVLTDTWYPGWRAVVDGVEATVWRANHAFRAVWLPPGDHAIEFRYAPRSFRVGLALTAAAACLVVPMFLWGGRRGDGP